MGLRDRLQERRGDTDGGVRHFKMRQKLVSFGDDFWIEDEQGNRVYKVNGQMLRVRETLVFEDAGGRALAKIQERMVRVRDTMNVEDADGQTLATVKRALVAPLRDRWKVAIASGEDLTVQGNVWDHEYTIEQDGRTVAEVSKKWFRIADTYGVEVTDGYDPVVILAVTSVIDTMCHEEPG